jgi:hypothetical protein
MSWISNSFIVITKRFFVGMAVRLPFPVLVEPHPRISQSRWYKLPHFFYRTVYVAPRVKLQAGW